MIRIGFWLVAAAVACLAVTFLPTLAGGAEDFEFVANAVFCDGGRAVLSVNLSEAALAKGNLGSVVAGYCADVNTGQRLGPIPANKLGDWLTIALLAAISGVILLGIGLLRRKGRQSVGMAAEPSGAGPSSKTAAQVRQRDAEDWQARTDADYQRKYAPAAAARPVPAAASIPDWMAGMPAASLPSSPPPPSQRFDFGEPAASAPKSDLKIQLNLLQLAYESSLITRSEYDARRAALLGPGPGG